MARKKLKRFEKLKTNSRVLEMDGKKNQTFDPNFFVYSSPIVLEVGCGNGEYTTGLAKLFKDKNFLGIDVKGDRIFNGLTQIEDLGLLNAGFVRMQIDHLDKFFAKNSVSEIWITFPDPRPKQKDEKRRLVSPKFLEIYKNILCGNNRVHLKTDSAELFEYSLDLIQKYPINDLKYTRNLYASSLEKYCFNIKTKYEKIFLEKQKTIKYLQFELSIN